MDAPVPTDQIGGHDQRHRSLAVALVCLVTVVATEAMSVSTIMPIVRRDLGGTALYGWVFSAFFLAEIVSIVVVGQWSDRAPLVQPLSCGLGLFAAGLIVGATAPSMLVLVIGRILQGFGAGAVPGVAYVCIGRAFREDRRPRLFAVLSTAWIVPSLAAPYLSVEIANHFGWRWVFGGLIPITVIVGGLALRPVSRVPGSTAVPESERVVVPALLLTLGAGVMLVGFGLDEPVVAILVGLVGVAITVGSLRELTPRGTLRAATGLPSAVALRGVLTFAMFSGDAFVTLALTSARHTTATFAAVALASASFSWTGGSWLAQRFVDRLGTRMLYRIGIAVVGCGSGLMLLTVTTTVTVGVGVLAWFVAGLGIGIAYSPLSVAALALAPEGREGFATSSLQLTDVLGASLGTGLAGVLVATANRTGSGVSHGVAWVYIMSIGVAAAGVVVSRNLPGPAVAVASPGLSAGPTVAPTAG